MEKEKNKNSRIIVLVIVLCLIASGLGGYGGYILYNKEVSNKEDKKSEIQEVTETTKIKITDIFENFAGTYIETNHSDACGDFKLTLNLTKDGKANVDIKDECSGDKNGSGIYAINDKELYIIYDKPLPSETEVNYSKFDYTYDNSKLVIYSNNKELEKQ